MIANKARFRAARKLERAAGFRLPDHVFSGAFLESLGKAINFENLDRRMHEQLLAFSATSWTASARTPPSAGARSASSP